LTSCFKLALMHQHAMHNRFEEFKRIKNKLAYGTALNFSIYAPLVTVMCELLEWVIAPFLKK
jgi:hypothetical protein